MCVCLGRGLGLLRDVVQDFRMFLKLVLGGGRRWRKRLGEGRVGVREKSKGGRVGRKEGV